jgi:predicted dehydrogenase
MSLPSILIVGTGSAGQRHAKNLGALGAQITCFDPRADRLQQIKKELPLIKTHDVFQEVLSSEYSGVVIASPPSFHVAQATAFLELGIPIFLEKPISPDLTSALRLQHAARLSDVPLLLGYTYRWWPPLIELRRRLQNGVLGSLRHARFVMSAHLADWHPWENYRDFFMASRELGGGALLDESHFIDLMLWLFGLPTALLGRVERLSSLEITSDDNVDVIAVYANGFRVIIHLDLYGRPHEKSVSVIGEEGTLQCLFDPNVLRFSTVMKNSWQITTFDVDRNDMFLSAAQEFLEIINTKHSPSCSVADGVQVLRCVEAIRKSTSEERTIPLVEIC